MSRNEKFLRELCIKNKIYVESLHWEPIHRGAEMQGLGGGWILNDFTPIALSTEEAAKYLSEHPDHFEKIEDSDKMQYHDEDYDSCDIDSIY